MEAVRREMAQGKLRPATLPPISYFAEDLPMLPGEAGTRLLQSVRVGEKVRTVLVRVSNSLVPDETPSYSASHPDLSCWHIGLCK